MTIVFGDTEWQDAIDLNPDTFADLKQVQRHYDRAAAALVRRARRRDRREVRRLAAIGRRFVVIAVLARKHSAVEWMDVVSANAQDDYAYQQLADDAVGRGIIKLLIGDTLAWLIGERSLT